MKKDDSRVRVVRNIERAIKENDLNRKVEETDPVMTEEQRKRVILKFDILKKNPINKLKANIARNIVDKLTKQINAETEIVGLENIENIETGAIITSNHFSKVDNTVIRYLMQKIGKSKNFYIIVQETNMLMEGQIGWLLKNCYTIPICSNFEYTGQRFLPALKKIFDRKGFLLIYPEKEMWYNYRKPRRMKIGAYHYACKFDIPVVPCFIEIQDTDTVGEDGFYASKYKLHVLPPIYPDKTKNLKERKEEMLKKDYEVRVKKYEEIYLRKYDAEFDNEKDIAGWCS